ncbi:type 1 glutamine amidotransferase domain-containing protein [Cellulomonas sp. HZM]|uniref:type 1 glutamine amidotransferase domain-containing protein n=1 Tax=Cellulomonas sp. HZM TaxID=1454010 RepID=UPI000493809F|nr:type 1 glutamine amidotransferase domain-containing protein [Cellulomonas sp. HZM]
MPVATSRVLTIVSNYGVEQDELVVPVGRLRDAGATVTVAAVKDEPVRTLVGDKDPGDVVTPDATLGDVDAADFDLLVIPGGTLNADQLRLDDDALALVDAFATAGKPVAAICHGPWLLATADKVRERSMTSYASLQTDLRNAGATWSDEPVVVDEGAFTLITSRDPDDLDDFVGAITTTLG